MDPPTSHDQEKKHRDEARAFEGAYKKMKAERDRLLNELEDARKQIR